MLARFTSNSWIFPKTLNSLLTSKPIFLNLLVSKKTSHVFLFTPFQKKTCRWKKMEKTLRNSWQFGTGKLFVPFFSFFGSTSFPPCVRSSHCCQDPKNERPSATKVQLEDLVGGKKRWKEISQLFWAWLTLDRTKEPGVLSFMEMCKNWFCFWLTCKASTWRN